MSYAGRVRILVVEDEARLRTLLHRGLTEEGHVVDAVADGPTGLWHAVEQPYDVVVLDVMLPGLDGLAVCRQLRERGSRVPVLLLTARDTVPDRIRGLDAGADDYLVKPFAFGELTARCRALSRRGPVERGVVLAVGDLVMDPASRVVTRAGTPVSLTAQEYTVLEVFLRHPGRVLDRSFLLDRAWDFAYEANSNVIDQYVAALRRKLDKPFGRDDFETVRGSGYRLRS
ncbi:MAG: two component transcriptional regulator, winged helix family [Mycobacterium sp.]|nr:two component transcriptional regulator, winged helix family [Mycobacterium sp.]